jgi:hypothetical protein
MAFGLVQKFIWSAGYQGALSAGPFTTPAFTALTKNSILIGTFTAGFSVGKPLSFTVTDSNSVNYPVQDIILDTVSNQYVGSFYGPVTTGGGTTLSLAVSGWTTTFVMIWFHEVSGASLSATPDGHAAQFQDGVASGTNSLTSGNTAALGNLNDYLYGGCCNYNSLTVTISAGTNQSYAGQNSAATFITSVDENFYPYNSRSAVSAQFSTNAGPGNYITTCLAAPPDAGDVSFRGACISA